MANKNTQLQAALSGSKFIREIYDDIIPQLLNLISIIGGPSLAVDVKFYVNRASSYVRLWGKKKDRYLIVIGGLDIKKTAMVPDRITSVTMIYEVGANVIKAIKAIFNHELAHIIFSALKSTEIINYKEEKYISFMQKTWNCLEDPFIEYSMVHYYKSNFPYHENPKKFFDFLLQTTFLPMGEEYEDYGNQESFMEYLLLLYRIGEDNIANRNAIFDKYEQDLNPLLNNVMCEPDASERVHNVVILCEWIIDNIKEFDWEFPESDGENTYAGTGAGGSVGGTPKSGTPMKKKKRKSGGGAGGGMSGTNKDEESSEESEEPNEDGETEEEAPRNGNPEGTIDHEAEADYNEHRDELESEEETEEDEESEPEEESEEESEDEKNGEEESEEEEEEESEDEEEDEEICDTPDEELSDDFVDELVSNVGHYGDDHAWFIAKDECEVPNSVLEEVNKALERNNNLSKEVSDYFNLCKSRRKPIRTTGLSSGKLDIKRAISSEAKGGMDIKNFYKKQPRGKIADICSYLLIDDSGSMSGTKSKIAFEAGLAIGQACEWASVPCAISAFVHGNNARDGYTNTTVVEKSFDDSFEEAKGYLALNNSDLYTKIPGHSGIGLFNCNEEEVNIWYIWRELRKVTHQTKLMFVICDGMTCGSRAELRETVAAMEDEDGIIVIGIGIMCDEVADSYRHYKVFNSIQELQEGLAPYIMETIEEYTF